MRQTSFFSFKLFSQFIHKFFHFDVEHLCIGEVEVEFASTAQAKPAIILVFFVY